MALNATEKAKFDAQEKQLADQAQQLAELTASLAGNKNKLEQAEAVRDQHRAALNEVENKLANAAEEIDVLTGERDNAREEVEGCNVVLAELNGELSKAQAELAGRAELSAGKRNAEVAHEGKNYQVVIARFNYKGQDYTAADVTEGSELLAELVAIGSGVVVETAE